MAELKELFNHIDQIGFVVKDIEKARVAMKHIFDLNPIDCGVIYHKNTLYRGKPTKCGAHILCYDFFNVELELISPVGDEESTWKEFRDEYGNGIHHIRFNIPDHEAAKQALAEKGIEACHCGDSSRGGGIKFAYYDLGPALGFIVETLNLREFEKDK